MNNEELTQWQNRTGLSKVTNMESSIVNEILTTPSNVFLAKSPRDLQKDLIVLSRYKMFIIKEIGLVKSKLDLFNRKLEHQINLTASKQNAQAKDERRALATQHDEKASGYMKDIEGLEIKYNQLKAFPDGIQGFIDNLRRLEWEKSEEIKAENKIND